MGFRKGKTGRFRVTFRVKAKKAAKTVEARTKELKKFLADLKGLARKFNGTARGKLPKLPR